MDFKIAGNETGITTFQLDIKSEGLTLEVLQDALLQAKRLDHAHTYIYYINTELILEVLIIFRIMYTKTPVVGCTYSVR